MTEFYSCHLFPNVYSGTEDLRACQPPSLVAAVVRGGRVLPLKGGVFFSSLEREQKL